MASDKKSFKCKEPPTHPLLPPSKKQKVKEEYQLVLGIRTGTIDEKVVDVWVLNFWHKINNTRNKTKRDILPDMLEFLLVPLLDTAI